MAAVRDNKPQNRFELDIDGAVAFANYRVTPSTVIITHTETPRALRGRGIAWVQTSAIAGAIAGPLLLVLSEPLGQAIGRDPLHIVWWMAPLWRAPGATETVSVMTPR